MTTPILLHPIPSSEASLQAFFTRHQDLLKLERTAEEEQTRLLNSNCSPRLLEQRGLALGGLGVASISIGLGGKSLVELVRPAAYHVEINLPPHTFRNGDPVRVEAHVGSSGIKGKGKKKAEDDEGVVEGIVYRVSADKVVVAVDGGKDIDLPERLRLLKLANSVTFDRMERTLSHLQRILLPDPTTPIPSTHAFNLELINVLLSKRQPTWTNRIPETIASLAKEGEPSFASGSRGDIEWLGENLNDSQKEAIRFCLTAEHVACIHGPPGTGKTHTLVELIYQLLLRPSSSTSTSTQPPRILITTPSNLALDNLLLRLQALSASPPFSQILPRGNILRLGHPTRVHKDLIGVTLDYKAKNGDDGELVRDVGRDIEGVLGELGRKRGEKGSVKGKERGKKWDEVRELRKEYRQRESKVVTNVVKGAQVVLATCHSAGSRQINNMTFDVCIVDEATQAIEAVCWVPILRSKKVVLAGDPQQLPPTILSKNSKLPKTVVPAVQPTEESGEGTKTVDEHLEELQINGDRPALRPPRTLETTLFDRLERLYGAGIKRVLQTQYRMNEQIATFPSDTLYDSSLISSSSVAKRTLLTLPSMLEPESEDAKDALEHPVIFFDTAGCEFYEKSEGDGESTSIKGIGEGSKCNENEAEVVAKWARKLIALGVPAGEIAVVTPYQAQVSLISEMLHSEYPDMTIGSVDGLQGQEREAIILSLVRSNSTGEVGFLGEYRRLNVAMTRAKRQLCVVGDSSTVGKRSKYLKAWMEWLEGNADVRYAGDEVI